MADTMRRVISRLIGNASAQYPDAHQTNAVAAMECLRMTALRGLPLKTERLELRLSPATRSLLAQAARLRHTSLTEFLVSSAVRAAEDAMAQPKLFEIESDAGWDVLTGLLADNGGESPNGALVALMRRSGPDNG